MIPVKDRESLFKAIDIMIQKAIESLKFSCHIEGTIMQVNINNTYDIKINGEITPNLKAIDDKKYKRGDVVKIIVINNNYSEKYIHFKRP